jgi:hypothetical protein
MSGLSVYVKPVAAVRTQLDHHRPTGEKIRLALVEKINQLPSIRRKVQADRMCLSAEVI